jgi:hypothetical protein
MGKIRPIGSDEVMQELQVLSPFVASLPKVNPFTVPEDYFGELVTRFAPSAGAPAGGDLPEGNPFKVPMGYFEELPGKLFELAETQAHLGPDLTGLRDTNPFTVPEGYFDRLSASIVARAKKTSSPTRYRIGFQIRVVAAAAALVVAVLMILPMIERNDDFPITADAMHEYVLANVESFSDAEIIEFIGEDALSDMLETDAMLDETELNQYLLEEVNYYQLQDEWL